MPGLRWGTLVLGQGYRNPALTAKMAATIQFLTGGRFILGLGAGDAEAEHHAYGYPFPAGRVRVEQLDEAATIIRALWQGGPATFTGAHYQIADAYCMPKPAPPPVLMIGGGGERRTLRVVATHADWWNADYYTPAEYARKLGVLHDHCHAIGRDPAAIVPTCYMGISLSRDESRLIRRRSMGHRGEVHVVSGDPGRSNGRDRVVRRRRGAADATEFPRLSAYRGSRTLPQRCAAALQSGRCLAAAVAHPGAALLSNVYTPEPRRPVSNCTARTNKAITSSR